MLVNVCTLHLDLLRSQVASNSSVYIHSCLLSLPFATTVPQYAGMTESHPKVGHVQISEEAGLDGPLLGLHNDWPMTQ